MIGTTLEAKDSPGDFDVHLSELVIASRVEGSRHTPVQHGINHSGIQQAGLQAEPNGRHLLRITAGAWVAV